MSAEEIQQKKQARQDNFIRALEMANLIINHNPEILAYYWYLWTCRVRTYSDSIPAEQMTRSMIRQMPVPTGEQLLLLKQQIKLFGVLVNNTKMNSGSEILYALTKKTNEEKGIYVSNHIFDVDNGNMRSLLWLFGNHQ